MPPAKDAPCRDDAKAYLRNLLFALALVHLIRGLVAAGQWLLSAIDGSSSMPIRGASVVVGALLLFSFLLHVASLLVSGAGLLARKPWGWKGAMVFYGNEIVKYAGSLGFVLLAGTVSNDMLGLAGTLAVKLVMSAFMLSIFFIGAIAELCGIPKGEAFGKAAPWLAFGAAAAGAKLYCVLG